MNTVTPLCFRFPGCSQALYAPGAFGFFFACRRENAMQTFRFSEWTQNVIAKARFIRRISAVSNAIETIDNEMICFIVYCLNCIRHGRNATYERGLRLGCIPWFCATL